jgi:putative restriction endonuclease
MWTSGTHLENLPARHRNALSWYAVNHRRTIGWPSALPDGTHLVTKAKGIYKPKWSKYALSVRETLTGRYSDRQPIFRRDGSWVYVYHQEGDPDLNNNRFTNNGLHACIIDDIPVGVLRQVNGKPQVRYEVLGLAMVTGSGEGYFLLEGFSQGSYTFASILSGGFAAET